MRGTSDNTGKADAARKTVQKMTQKADRESRKAGAGKRIQGKIHLPANPVFLLEGAALAGIAAYLLYDSAVAAVFLLPLIVSP